MAKKITVEELNAKVGDLSIPEEELAKYFQVDEARSGPMDPALSLNPDLVQIPDAADQEGRERSAAMLNSANWICRLRRQAGYHRKVGSGGYKGPLIVSEGDSWFQYPFILKDVIDCLSDDFAVFSLGAAGDTLDNMVRRPEYLDALEDTGASILLLSGGGNDLVAGGSLAKHLRDYDPRLSPEGHLLGSFDGLLDHAMAQIDKIVRGVGRAFPNVNVICHGYDYSQPANGSWLGKPMVSRGIKDGALQKAIAVVMVDRLNTKLRALAATTQRLTYIDCRGKVGPRRWHDELHPTNAGYADVAKLFKAEINRLAPARPRTVTHMSRSAPPAAAEPGQAAPQATSPRKRAREATAPEAAAATGRSLHIGLNTVDPEAYEGWDGALTACEFDAEDMTDIAASVGFSTTTLLTAKATRKAVTSAITKAAKASKPGDIFLMTYAGHGGQVTDFNNDEDDKLDETLCLFDGQLIDDELYVLWSLFPADVRVLVISDCCHSGTNVRARLVEDTLAANPGPAGTPRAMPLSVASRVMRRKRDFYRKNSEKAAAHWKGANTREMALPLSASVRLLSAVQDNQVALDGLENGLFTGRLREVWGDGAFQGDYAAFHRALMDTMPPSQSPNHFTTGQASPAFDAQRPFDI
jgi:hypothetical protein